MQLWELRQLLLLQIAVEERLALAPRGNFISYFYDVRHDNSKVLDMNSRGVSSREQETVLSFIVPEAPPQGPPRVNFI